MSDKPCVVRLVGDATAPVCAYLSDGTKITIGRTAETRGPAWLKIERQAKLQPAALPAREVFVPTGCPHCTRGFIRCADPECATCASDNDPDCPNATRCPHCSDPLSPLNVARGEVEMLRGVGCGEDGDGPCGSCIKCARRERDEAIAARDALAMMLRQIHEAIARGDHGPAENAKCIIDAVLAAREENAELCAERDAAVSMGTQLERRLQEAELTRSNANGIIEALLRRVYDDQWSGRQNTACHCHPEYSSACPECHELEVPHRRNGSPFNPPGWSTPSGEHKSDCERKAVIDRASAFLRAENELAKEKDSDEWWTVP